MQTYILISIDNSVRQLAYIPAYFYLMKITTMVYIKLIHMRSDPGIACIFGSPLIEDGQTVKNRKRVELEAPKIGGKTETW